MKLPNYSLSILLIYLLGIKAGTNQSETPRKQFIHQLESTVLQPALQGLLPELEERWKFAVATCQSDDELLEIANDIAADYSEWREQRDLAVASVINDTNIGIHLASFADFGALGTLSHVTKNSNISVEKDLVLRYMKNHKVDWSQLIPDIVKSYASQRGPLIGFLRRHWPKSEDPLVSSLLARALSIFREYLADPSKTNSWFPYIPGYYDLTLALSNSSVIASPHPFTDVYFYEDENIIQKFPHGDFSAMEVKSILCSGNEKAIKNFCTAFPAYVDPEAKTTPAMTWKNWQVYANVMLAIQHHKDTKNHEALIDFVTRCYIDSCFENSNEQLIRIMMESGLSTVDILGIVGESVKDEDFFNYPKRAIEIIKTRGFKGHRIDFDLLKEEKFIGTYTKEIEGLLGEINFFQLVIIAGADDDFLMEEISKRHAMLPSFLLFSAIETDRSVKLVDFLLEKQGPTKRASGYPIYYRLPIKYIPSFFRYDQLGLTFFGWLKQVDFNDSERLRVAVRSLTPNALKSLLFGSTKFDNELVHVVFYEELIDQLRDPHKRAVFNSNNKLLCQNPAFKFALSLQNQAVLKEICNLSESNVLNEALRKLLK